MARLKDKAITLLGSATINMAAGSGTQTIFTTDVGKVTRVTHVVVRDISASLAGGTSFSFLNFRQTVDLSGITSSTTTTYRVIQATDNTSYTETAASTAYTIAVTQGATSGSPTAVIDVFGYTTA